MIDFLLVLPGVGTDDEVVEVAEGGELVAEDEGAHAD